MARGAWLAATSLLLPLARATESVATPETLISGATVEYEQREADSWRWWVMAGRALGYLQVFFDLPPYFEQNLDRKLKISLRTHVCTPSTDHAQVHPTLRWL